LPRQPIEPSVIGLIPALNSSRWAAETTPM
jgi:hypothetical protein